MIEVAGWRTLWEITNAHLIGHVVVAPDGTRLAAGGGGRVSLIRAADGQVELTTGGEGVGAAADAFKGGPAFSRDSHFLVRRVWGEPSLGILDLERGVERMASWPGGPHVYACLRMAGTSSRPVSMAWRTCGR